jgi:hypothetical protein
MLSLLVLSLSVQYVNAQTTEIKYLSGTGSDNTVDWQFYCTGGMNSGKWTTIPVPSCWELQKFGKYDYGYAKDSVARERTGIVQIRICCSRCMGGTRLLILFLKVVMTDAEVKVKRTIGRAHSPGRILRFQI